MRVLVLVGMVAGIGASGCERIPGTDQHIMAKGKAAAADLLIDPSSAQFRRVELRKVQGAKDDAVVRQVICGEINGKNRGGAYVGFTRFIANPDNGEVLMEPVDVASDREAEIARRRCQAGVKQPLYSEAERELRMMDCERAAEMHSVRASALEFSAVHQTYCEVASGKPESKSSVD